ncbi:MAG TPA: ATP-binding protein [Ktedonobacteraceae bacterium]|nr:ATP-binding protein [Ktedonobacteraceae bacterium]
MQSELQVPESARRSSNGDRGDRLMAIRQEMEYLNTIGKRFVAALDRIQVHRALLAALQELYSFSACCILLRGDPFELFIIPCYPLDAAFLESMFQRIASAANALNFPNIAAEQLARTAYYDAPDELAQLRSQRDTTGTEIGSCLNIPLTVENRIIGMLSLFDERPGTFDTNLLQLTTMIADYAAVALENVRLRERENALWRQAEMERIRLELIISSMAEGLLITDARGAISSLNTSAEQLLTKAQIDLQPDVPLRKLAETSHVHWLTKLAETIGLALSGKTVKNQEIVAGADGETVPLTLNISAAPIHDASGTSTRPIGVVAVLNDVTSNKQVERLKDEFVSVVSHELRTPLTAIKGYTQHLVRRIERRLRKARATPQENNPANADLPESYDLRSLNIIQSQTEHLERLVNDLLDLSQVQWGQLSLNYEPFYLADLLAENVRSVQASAEQHTIYLDIQVQDTKVVADRVRIGQVVGNILDNAIKYSPHGGQVIVNLQMQGEDYLVSISDQGVGVSPEHYDHIFERFYRVHNTASHQYSGIGLGLYVAKAIIDRHGGRIWFTNNQNTGSTFHFTLPSTPGE